MELIELYQAIIPSIEKLDFVPIKRKLHEISKTEDKGQSTGPRSQGEKHPLKHLRNHPVRRVH